MGYSPCSHAYRVFNEHNLSVEKLAHVIFDDTNLSIQIPDEEPPIQNTPTHVSNNETQPEDPIECSKKFTTPQDKVVIPRE